MNKICKLITLGFIIILYFFLTKRFNLLFPSEINITGSALVFILVCIKFSKEKLFYVLSFLIFMYWFQVIGYLLFK